MNVSDFNYELPKELIAQDPLEKRSESGLMVLDKETGEVTHKHFYDISEYINEGDCLVINNTRCSFTSHNTFDKKWVYAYGCSDNVVYAKKESEIDACYEVIIELIEKGLL